MNADNTLTCYQSLRSLSIVKLFGKNNEAISVKKITYGSLDYSFCAPLKGIFFFRLLLGIGKLKYRSNYFEFDILFIFYFFFFT